MTARYKVTSPVTTYTGAVGELTFVKGVYEGEVSDAALQYFETAGYGVEKLGDAATAEQPDADAAAAAPAEADAVDADQAAADAAAANQTGESQ